MNFAIRQGRLYDPRIGKTVQKDLFLANGKFLYDEREMPAGPVQTIDAANCFLTPGLIDYHTHYFYQGSENGVNADASSFCMGITTAVDGGTAGAGNFELFHSTIMTRSSVRLLSYLLVASGGQSNDRYPENLDPRYFDEEKILELFQRYPQELIGLKTRISKSIIPSPELARASLKRTVEIAEKAHTRVIVHVTDCTLPLDELAALLRPGDVICHIYQNRGEHTCLDKEGKVLLGLWEAKKRGILFDASNGRSNFDLATAQKAIAQGFLPDIISSDNNQSSWFLPPLYSLPRILSKYREFDMSWEAILNCATRNPAKLIGRPDLGTLQDGSPADLVIWKRKQKDVEYTDINGNRLHGHEVLIPLMTFKEGQCVYCQADFL